jgi:serine/threonine protein kinase
MAEEDAGGRVVGRYAIYDEIASGGMATVHVGRLLGPVGFSRTVAIKRLHPQFAKDPEFVAMFLDEARLAARIRHPNVVATIDVVATRGELLLVMEYVQGESLAQLSRVAGARAPIDPAIAVSLMLDTLHGLHAAHEATDERGDRLHIVHRDVSPQNILLGTDGMARVVDFGIAKAAWRAQTTRDGAIKGKLAYMSPEQVSRKPVDRRTDVFAASIVLWECLTGARMFASDDPGGTIALMLTGTPEPPGSVVRGIPPALDEVVLRGLARDPDARFKTSRAMAAALEKAYPPASRVAVAEWVERSASEALRRRSRRLAEIESGSAREPPIPLTRSEAPTAALEDQGDARAATRTGSVDATSSRVTGPVVTDTPVHRRFKRSLPALTAFAIAGIASAVALFEARDRSAAKSATPLPGDAAPASASAEGAPPESSSAAASAPATVDAAAPSAPPRPLPAASPAPRARGECNPPYAWDPVRHIKVYKERCFN